MATGIVIGEGVGTSVGIITKNIGLWISMSIALGTLALFLYNKKMIDQIKEK